MYEHATWKYMNAITKGYHWKKWMLVLGTAVQMLLTQTNPNSFYVNDQFLRTRNNQDISRWEPLTRLSQMQARTEGYKKAQTDKTTTISKDSVREVRPQ